MTDCTAIVVEQDGRVLLLRRREDAERFPGLWTLPGGRVEDGETIVGCARRELREETGLEIGDPRWLFPLGQTKHDGLCGHVFRLLGWIGDPENLEPDVHSEIGWFDVGMPPGPLFDGTAEVIGWIQKRMAGGVAS